MNANLDSTSSRRDFIKSTALAVTAAAVATPSLVSAQQAKPAKVKLGFDNFSIRNSNWKAGKVLEYAAEQKVDVVLFSDLDVYENHTEAYLKDLKKKADDLGIEIQGGTGSICPTSNSYGQVKKWGTAEEHLKLTIKIAKTLGSKVARCYLGNARDRASEGGIEARMKDTVATCKAVKSYAQDNGIKIAIENHAGDMQAWELQTLIEEAGKDYVGATIDPGNATWTLEDPHVNLEILAPYAACAGIRDSIVWETPNGANAKWAAVGEGVVDMKAYLKRWVEVCPGVPVTLEIISEYAKQHDYLKPEFWKVFPKVRPYEFARFTALARKGKPAESFKGSGQAQADYQKAELERSIKYCKTELGLGLKG
ncbi:MAG: Xylose isomerase-like barrel [Verrucomicrobia bacterium]|jgi:sugar phosphate isomerase/epimerase|nr:Xylose isomerase-like barrel [Verrucomicrobiota bacterium]